MIALRQRCSQFGVNFFGFHPFFRHLIGCFFLDIVFCRTWYKVDVPEFYCPVTTLLLPPEEKNAWRGVRTTGEIKREQGLRNPANKDSLYTVSISEIFLCFSCTFFLVLYNKNVSIFISFSTFFMYIIIFCFTKVFLF